MSVEVWMLLVSAVLGIVQPYPYVFGKVGRAGLLWGIGNREGEPEVSPWVKRAERAHRNYLENLPMFAIVTLVALVTARTNQWTAWAAIGFIAARLLYWPVYIAGIPWIRTVLYNAGVACTLIIAAQVALW